MALTLSDQGQAYIFPVKTPGFKPVRELAKTMATSAFFDASAASSSIASVVFPWLSQPDA